jgi:hypothetical protein
MHFAARNGVDPLERRRCCFRREAALTGTPSSDGAFLADWLAFADDGIAWRGARPKEKVAVIMRPPEIF